MPTPRPTSLRVVTAVRRVIDAPLTVVRADGTRRRTRLGVMPRLILDAFVRFATQPRRFGRVDGTLDAALATIFERLPLGTPTAAEVVAVATWWLRRTDRRAGAHRLDELVTTAARDLPVADGLARLRDAGLLPEPLTGPLVTGEPRVPWRALDLRLDHITCEDPQEVLGWPSPGDEVYVITTSHLVGPLGLWPGTSRTRRTQVQEEVRAGDAVETKGVRQLLARTIEATPGADEHPPLVSVVASVTVVEHDQGDTDRILAGMEASWAAISAISAAGPWGLIALPGLLAHLAIALDGDDELGSIAVRFDDVLAGEPTVVTLSADLADDDDYRYSLATTFTTTDLLASPAGLAIAGPGRLHAAGYRVAGTYQADSAAPLTAVTWAAHTVTAPDAADDVLAPPHVADPAALTTAIEFSGPGHYQIELTAATADRTMTARRDVTVTSTITHGDADHHPR